MLDIEITHRCENAVIEDAVLEEVIDRVRWRTTPEFARPGRTAWHKLPSSVYYKNRPGLEFRAAKLKGVGAWNPRGVARSEVQRRDYTDTPVQPTITEYEPTARLHHMGITPEGEFTDVTSSPAPYGGILHDRAALEYNNSAVLLDYGVPSIAPLFVVRYSALLFRNQPMGAVVSLSPESSALRAHIDDIGEPDSERRAFFDELYRALGIEGDPALPIVQWRAFAATTRRAGGLLRAFAQAGLYRYSMHLENLHFDRNRSELFLTDLDSARMLNELPPHLQGLELLRDISAGLHKIAWRFHYFAALDRWPTDKLRLTDPFAEFLRGYFGEFSSLDLENLVTPIWRVLMPHILLRRRWMRAMTEWDRERIQSYEVDRSLFCSLAIVLVSPMLRAVPSLAPRIVGLDQPILARKIERFLGPERSDYLSFVLK